MSTTTLSKPDLAGFAAEIRTRANAQFESPQSQRLMAMRMTRERARLHSLQRVHFTRNRRDCWAFAQALAPMDVKKLIWEHEEDELAGSRARGTADHFTLQVVQGDLLGLTPEDFVAPPLPAGTRTCTYAWTHLVTSGPWQKSVAACAALEIGNSSDWVVGGGLSYRMGKKLEADLGIPFHKQVNAAEHAEVDVEHGHMLMRIAAAYHRPADLALMMEGLIESWEIDRIWRGVTADLLEGLPAS
jgi:hypothetical protein